MNLTAVSLAVLLLVLVILVGNTMIAVAFLKGRKGRFKRLGSPDDEAIDELHRRVQKLPPK
jgi:hypothetical protein